jgi:hypothetical protein
MAVPVAFTVNGVCGEGAIGKIDGVVELDEFHDIVEMKS